jgi:hypothetical protein
MFSTTKSGDRMNYGAFRAVDTVSSTPTKTQFRPFRVAMSLRSIKAFHRIPDHVFRGLVHVAFLAKVGLYSLIEPKLEVLFSFLPPLILFLFFRVTRHRIVDQVSRFALSLCPQGNVVRKSGACAAVRLSQVGAPLCGEIVQSVIIRHFGSAMIRA